MQLTQLKPEGLWHQFDQILRVPRPSKHEEKIREYILSWAADKGFESSTDHAGNVVVRVPATAGRENAPAIVMQSHMDMVCEKNKDVEFDFFSDAIEVERQGDWLTAKGTTLGADNGVGLAASMAIAEDPDVVHGPLEILATVDEETGLTGAAELSPDLIRGRRLLNLDTEELGALYIGCAGGGDSNLDLPTKTTKAPSGAGGFRVKVKGLRGGHSGMDIVEQRGNAIQLLARIVSRALAQYPLNLVRFEGGGVHNAIPREAAAECACDASAVDAIAKIVESEGATILAELGTADPGFQVEVSPMDAPTSVWDGETTKKVLNLVLSIPHGVDSMSKEVPGLVETSNNLASAWTKDDRLVIGTSSRSSVNTALQAIRDRIRAAGELAGAAVQEGKPYPGWQPDLDSKLLAVTAGVHERLFGKKPEVKAVHAGLECGIIGEKVPGMDMVSFGPTIEAPHSPDERIDIPSVEAFWELLTAVVEELAGDA